MRRTRAAAASTDPQFEALREKWWPRWCVWRSRGDDGELRSWCATHLGQGGKPSRTLIEPTAEALEAALERDTGGPVLDG